MAGAVAEAGTYEQLIAAGGEFAAMIKEHMHSDEEVEKKKKTEEESTFSCVLSHCCGRSGYYSVALSLCLIFVFLLTPPLPPL